MCVNTGLHLGLRTFETPADVSIGRVALPAAGNGWPMQSS